MNRFVQATNKEGATCVNALPRPVPITSGHGLLRREHGRRLSGTTPSTSPSTTTRSRRTTGRRHPAPSTSWPDAPRVPRPTTSSTVTQGVLYGDADPVHDICSDPAKGQATLTGPNVGDLLTQAGVSWGWFQGGFRLDPAVDPAEACEGTSKNLAGTRGDELRSAPQSVPVLRLDRQPGTPASVVERRDRARRPGEPPLRPGGLLDGRRRRSPAGRELPQGGRLPGRPPGSAELQPAGRAGASWSARSTTSRACPEWSSTAVVLAWDDSDGQVRPCVPAQRAPLGQRDPRRSLRHDCHPRCAWP